MNLMKIKVRAFLLLSNYQTLTRYFEKKKILR